MLPPAAKEALKKNLKWCFPGYYRAETDDFHIEDDKRARFAAELGISRPDSAFVDYYTIVGFTPRGRGEELMTLEEIETARDRDEFPELEGMKDFLRFTSIEGEGSYFYNRKTDEVFDANWGEEPDMVSGRMSPMYESFFDFLEWYYGEE